jgi:hypothetical protein
MTEPLTIKDLNCGNCSSLKIDSDGDLWCEKRNWLFTKEFREEDIVVVGCASHPLALQVLAQPVVVKLERLMTEARQEHDGAMSYGLRLDRRGKVDAMELAIKLLKGDAP